MTIGLQDLAAGIGTVGTATPDDVLALRRAVWADGVISADEAAVIFALNARLTDPVREWVDFFVEALSAWLLEEHEPRGYVDEGQAAWVLGQIAVGGPVATAAELELLAHVMEKAISTPEALRTYTLDQLEKSAISAGCVTANEVKLLRRVLFASGGDRPAGVSKREAEMLFRIKDACLTGDNAPEWKMLFVQGVANYLQGFGGYAPLSRERESELDAFMNSHTDMSIRLRKSDKSYLAEDVAWVTGGPILGRTVGAVADSAARISLLPAFGRAVMHKDQSHLGNDMEAAARAAADVTPEENAWLKREVEADGQVDEFEQALYDFLQQP